MFDLNKKIAITELLIRRTVKKVDPDKISFLWSGGKDSTALLFLIKNMYKTIPFKVFFADSSYEFNEIYELVDRLNIDWNIKLFKFNYVSEQAREKIKTLTQEQARKLLRRDRDSYVKKLIEKNNDKVALSGVRWQEHFHRVNRFYGRRHGVKMLYPILHWTQNDIWTYIRKYNIPYVSLYDKGYLHLDIKLFTQKQKVIKLNYPQYEIN